MKYATMRAISSNAGHPPIPNNSAVPGAFTISRRASGVAGQFGQQIAENEKHQEEIQYRGNVALPKGLGRVIDGHAISDRRDGRTKLARRAAQAKPAMAVHRTEQRSGNLEADAAAEASAADGGHGGAPVWRFGSPDHRVVVRMRADREPHEIAIGLGRQCAIAQSNAD